MKHKTPSHIAIAMVHRPLLAHLGIPQQKATTTCWYCRYEFQVTKPERVMLPDQKWVLLCYPCSKSNSFKHIDHLATWERNPQSALFHCARVVEDDFKKVTGVPIKALGQILIDTYGSEGFQRIFNRVTREGSSHRDGVRYLNRQAEVIASLVELYHSLLTAAA